MSATNYRNRWVDMAVQTVLSGVMMLLVLWLGFRDADAREMNKRINSKADKIELVEIRQEISFIEKGAKDYTDNIANQLREDSKTDRAEILKELQLLRKDIIDLWKSKTN